MNSISDLRKDFPLLSTLQKGKPIIYLDNAATTQKPNEVIDSIAQYYKNENANIHRGVYRLSEMATQKFEKTRELAAEFLGAHSPNEIIFTRGTTESINLVANSWGGKFLKAGDEVLITHMEHHSNIVPWQMICEKTGAVLKVAPINERGELLIDGLKALLSPKTKMLAFSHMSNALGTINPAKEIIQLAKSVGALTLIDGAQNIGHRKVNVAELGCDFYCFSGHKMYGPTGVGVLFGRYELLEKMDPYHGGGEMILTVSFEKTTYKEAPHKFEAGTPHISGVIGLGRAIEYMNRLDMNAVEKHEKDLTVYLEGLLLEMGRVRIVGTAKNKISIVSFVMEGVHPHDIGTIVDSENVCIRTGHHCAQPIMDFFGLPATARASLAFYNNREDCEKLVQALGKVRKVFG